MSWQAIHAKGIGACGKLAFTYLTRPKYGMESRNVVMPDGSHPALGSRIKCGSCGETVPFPNQQCEFREVTP